MALPKRTKKKTVRASARVRRGDKLTAPSWEGWEDWSGQEYHRHRDKSRAFYYENYKPVDLFPHTYKWMASNDYSKEDIKNAKASPPYELSITAAIIAKQLLDGMPDYNKKEDEYWDSLPGTMGKLEPVSKFLKERIAKAIEAGKEVLKDRKEIEQKKAKEVPQLSIQERLQQQAYVMCEGIEEWLDGFVVDAEAFDPKGFDFRKYASEKNITGAHARKIKNIYEHELDDYKDLLRMPTSGQLKKMSEEEADQWEQLKEGYAHLKKKHIEKYMNAVGFIFGELEFIIEKAKVNRKPRKKKVYSADKLVAKLKYLKVDSKYSLTSINPEDIIKANELWVFNVKTRKLGKYIASNIDPLGQGRDGTGLSVKGTTIIGYDEKLSIQKTLRKPIDQLKEFKDSGKVKLRKFLDEIPTTDTKLNGRVNPETVLLKVS